MTMNNKVQPVLLQLALIILLFAIPISAFYWGFSYYQNNQHELIKADLSNRLLSWLKRSNEYLDNNSFWQKELSNAFDKAKSPEDFKILIGALSHKYRQKLGWIIWHNNKHELSQNLSRYSNKDWKKTGVFLYKRLFNKIPSDDLEASFFLRRIFGPHLRLNKIDIYNKRIVNTDHENSFAKISLRHKPEFMALVAFPPNFSQKSHGIREFLSIIKPELEENETLLVCKNGKRFFSGSIEIPDKDIPRGSDIPNKGKLEITDDGFKFAQNIDENLSFHFSKKYDFIEPSRAAAIFAICHLFICILIFKAFPLKSLSANLKIRESVFGIICLANILPIVLLSFFSYQYLEQKYLSLIEKKRLESIAFIQMLENEFENEIQRFPEKMRTATRSFFKELGREKPTYENSKAFIENRVEENADFHLIASKTYPVVSSLGFFEKSSFINMSKGKSRKDAKKIIELLSKIGSCYTSFWNQETVPAKTMTEMELVADIAFQRPIEETLHMLIEINEKIGFFGFGRYSLPSFSTLFSNITPEKYDYLGIFQFNTDDSSKVFLRKMKNIRLANVYGLKTIFTRGKPIIPEEVYPFTDYEKLEKTIIDLEDYPPTNSRIVELQGQSWIFTGYKSNRLSRVNIAAFYPLEEIRNRLKSERNELILLIFFNIMIIFGLAYIFSKMLVKPVEILENGSLALRSKDFLHRVPSLGDDEFGYMGKILNEAIIDIEELNTAREVQQQLFPKKLPKTKDFELFGKSITLNDLGGDYIDYFNVDKTNFALLLGDVAGHGVGAALIMAMAKSLIINSEDLLAKPAELAKKLHSMIYDFKTKKQKKIMTFQYFFINTEKNELTFTNAGGCTPYLVKSASRQIQELKLPGAALGSFKNNKIMEKTFSFEPGDALVIYTDGIIEARNSEGEEIGYDRFKEILCECSAENAELFYQNVYAKYENWIEGSSPGDDMTMIFLTLPARKLEET